MGRFIVSLDRVRLFAYHGFFEQENRVGNEFEVNLKVEYEDRTQGASETDELENTVSYADLYEIVKSEMEKPRKLLETVAKDVAIKIKEKYPNVGAVECKITKLTPPISGFDGSASVTFLTP